MDAEGFCVIPFHLSSSTLGRINISNINISFNANPSPIVINKTIISSFTDNSTGFVNLPITFETSSNGTIVIDAIIYDHKGGNSTISILTYNNSDGADKNVNDTLNLIVYASNFIRTLPYIWTEHIFFLPRTVNSTNVTPFGQTSSTPIFNLTSTNFGGKDLNYSVKVNESFSCFNLTWSTTSTKPGSGNLINTSFSEFGTGKEYANNTNLWLWGDFNQCNASAQNLLTPNIDIDSYCVDCIWRGS